MSTIKTETLSTPSNATVPVDTVVNGTAKAWVNFNGTGTVAIRRAFNVSSITDLGTGYYSVNLTTAMPDVNYSVTSMGMRDGAYSANSNPIVVGIRMDTVYSNTVNTGSFAITTHYPGNALQVDPLAVNIAIFS